MAIAALVVVVDSRIYSLGFDIEKVDARGSTGLTRGISVALGMLRTFVVCYVYFGSDESRVINTNENVRKVSQSPMVAPATQDSAIFTSH